MPKRQKRVLLAMGWYDHRLHEGIGQYAIEQGWHLCPDTTREKVIPWGWEGDGILAWLGAGDDIAEFVVEARKPTVDFSFRRPGLAFPRVLLDHTGAARLVAEHFLSRDFEHFVFYSDNDNWSWEERGHAFVALLREAGHECNWLCWQRSPAFAAGRNQWQHKRRWLAGQLAQAPQPLAVFAATDEQAVDVLEACEESHLAVPEQISIVGADNSLVAVNVMHTPLSSIDVNMELLGYRGAALLDDLMKGKPPPAEPVRVPPRSLITRKSSDLIAINHKGIARSLRFLWEHSHEAITVDDLARRAGMSRRGFHQAFLEHIGRPPGHELQRVRVERAKKLLAESDQKLRVICELCGYHSANSLWSAFRKATGMSPKQYRAKFRRDLGMKEFQPRMKHS